MVAFLGYLILAVGCVISALMFYDVSQSEYRRVQVRARVAQGWHVARLRMRGRLADEQLTSLLRKSGLGIPASMYHYLRIGLTAILAVFAILDMLGARNVIAILMPVVVWFSLGYKKPMPMYYGFLALEKQAVTARNRSLYLLYRLVYQEILAFTANPISVNEMLRRQLGRVPPLRPNLEMCLDQWIDDPIRAMRQFGEELGSAQAKVFAHMLIQIEEAGIDVARDIFENNQDSFRSDRLSLFEVRLSRRALLGAGLTMVGFLAVSYDLQVVIQAYSNAMLSGAALH